MGKAVPKFADLKTQYQQLWDSAKTRTSFKAGAAHAASQIAASKARYQAVSEMTGVPWWWVGITHHMEAGGNFNCHLHNGDSLAYRTYHVPKGRPLKGNPVFKWEDSACDALTMKDLDEITDWSVASSLFHWEVYNGMGYRQYHPNTLSPYLWSGTQHYASGKYVEDGEWSATAVSGQVGAVAILKALLETEPGLFEAMEDAQAITEAAAPAPAPALKPIAPPPDIGPKPTEAGSFPKAHEKGPGIIDTLKDRWHHVLVALGLGGTAGAEVVHPALPSVDQLISAGKQAHGYLPDLQSIFPPEMIPVAIGGVALYVLLGHVAPSFFGGSE